MSFDHGSQLIQQALLQLHTQRAVRLRTFQLWTFSRQADEIFVFSFVEKARKRSSSSSMGTFSAQFFSLLPTSPIGVRFSHFSQAPFSWLIVWHHCPSRSISFLCFGRVWVSFLRFDKGCTSSLGKMLYMLQPTSSMWRRISGRSLTHWAKRAKIEKEKRRSIRSSGIKLIGLHQEPHVGAEDISLNRVYLLSTV